MDDDKEDGPDPSTLIDLFCRKSQAVKSRAGKREVSIKAQEARGRRVAAELGLTVRQVWREVGSASRFSKRKKRTEQDRALLALEQRQVGALWLFRVDRWDRKGAGSILKIIEPDDGLSRRLLIDNGDADNPGIGLDSTNPRDRRELIERAEQAREETEILSERVRNTKDAQRTNGEWINGTAPYGLKIVIVEVETEDDYGETEIIEERKLALDDTPAGDPANPQRTKADVAFEVMYTLPVGGFSLRRTAAKMNERNIAGPTGEQWATTTVRDMITNPVYAGWQTTGRQDNNSRRILYRNGAGDKVSVMAPGVSPIVSDDQQRRAKEAIRGAGARLETVHDTRAKHLLTGRLRCGGCRGAACWSARGYVCARRNNGKDCPAPVFVNGRSIEAHLYECWSARLTNSEPDDPLLAEVARRWSAVTLPEANADETALRMAVAVADEQLQRVWTDRRAGRYSGPSERFFDADLDEATTALRAAQQSLTAARGSTSVDITFLLEQESLEAAWAEADLPLRRELLGLAIDEIWVTKAARRGIPFNGDERVRIKWAA